jgi:hypothetical protein
MLSRNLSAKRTLSREFTQRYKRVASNSSGVNINKEQFLREQYDTNRRNTNQSTLTDKQLKQQILDNFDIKKIDELKKRIKFAPEDNITVEDIIFDGVKYENAILYDGEPILYDGVPILYTE